MSDAAALAFRILARVASGSSDPAEIAGAIGADTSVVAAAMDGLESAGALRRVGSRLGLGAAITGLIGDLAGLRDLAERAVPVLADLVRRSGCDAAFCVRDEDRLRTVSAVTSESVPDGMPWSGETRPLASSAGGIAVAAASGVDPAALGADAAARAALGQALADGWCSLGVPGDRTFAAVVRGIAVPAAIELRERADDVPAADDGSLAAMVRDAAAALARG